LHKKLSNYLKFIPRLTSLTSDVIYNSKPLDKSFEIAFKHLSDLKPADKEFLFQTATYIIRYWILLDEIYKNLFNTQKKDFQNILYIQQTIDRYVKKELKKPNSSELKIIECYQNASKTRHIRESYPVWLDDCCNLELRDSWDSLSNVLNNQAEIVLRANSLKTTTQELLQLLKNSGKEVSEIENYPDAIKLTAFFNVFKNELYQAGYFEMQDAASQRIAPFLDLSTGMRVIDACAGNGGKTLHISGLMKNKGKIIAMDIAPYKLEVLKKRLKRSGAFNVETRHIESSKTIKRMYNSADRLLLDVPCSGLGVLKRNPDIKYHITAEKLLEIQKTQGEILDKYSGVLTKGGIMVYATCSILPSENELQVKSFLEKKQGNFEMIEEKTISPTEGYDGFYMAKLKRI